MVPQKIFLTTLILFLLKPLCNSQFFSSPCPDDFSYTGENKNASEWYGTLKLRPSTNLLDVWLHLKFDTPFLQLKSEFGNVVTTNSTDSFIEIPNWKLEAHVFRNLKIILKYDPNKPIPILISFKLNGELKCRENRSSQNKTLVDVCGTVTRYFEHTIVNDELVYEGAFPWHAGLHYSKQGTYPYICGASLISPFYVITLARCIMQPKLITPDKIVVILGRHNLYHDTLGTRKYTYVSKIIPHPEYNSQTDLYNIALVKLKERITLNDYIRPVCLWQKPTSLTSLSNEEGIVVGWGLDPEDERSEELIPTKMLIVPNEKCSNSLQIFSDDSYCTAFKEGTTICSGNSGDGMVFSKLNVKTRKQVWQLRGLLTMGGLSKQCNTSRYVSFIDVTIYNDWIIKSME